MRALAAVASHIRGRPLLWVCLLFAAGSLLLVTPAYGLGWDEIIYVSQYSAHAPAAFMSAPRARGIPLLVGPVVGWTDSVIALRLYLTATATIALALAFWPWSRVVERPQIPALAAGFYASLWIALFYANSAMPNHYTAMAAVGAVGCLLLAASRSATGPAHVGLVTALVVAGLVRPADAFMLGAALVGAIIAVPTIRNWRLAAAVLVGLGLGVTPWIVEAQLRYGGIVERLRQASDAQGGTDPTFSLGKVAIALDGPLLCRPCNSPVQWPALLWWIALAVLIPLGTIAAHRAAAARCAWIPIAVAASTAFPYLFLINYSAPRFLLATYALLFIPAAWGFLHLLAMFTDARRRLIAAGLATGAIGHIAIQAGILVYVVDNQHREDWQRIAQILPAYGVHPPCVVTGSDTIPIAYYAGCRAMDDEGNNRNASITDILTAAATDSFALVIRSEPPPEWAANWRTIPLSGLTEPTWTLYLPQGMTSKPGS